MKEVFAENAKTSQIVHIFIGKIQILNVVDHLVQACTYRVAVIAGIGSEKNVKDYLFILPFDVVALHHGQFVQVCQQS